MRKLLIFLLLAAAATAVADSKKAEEKLGKAQRALEQGAVPQAEKLTRDAIKEDPNSVKAHVMLGELLENTKRFSEAAQEYTTALTLDDQQHSLPDADRLNILDQQAVSYAESGNLPRAKELYEAAIKKNADYPLFYYNLACTYAEMHQLDPALTNLKKAWSLRDKMPPNTPFPDPRKDSSFSAYVNDPRFQDAVRNMVF